MASPPSPSSSPSSLPTPRARSRSSTWTTTPPTRSRSSSISRSIEKSKPWESALAEIRGGLKPFLKQLRRELVDEDIVRLTEIRIKRISAYNRFQADEAMKKIEEGMKETKGHLKNLTGYAVAWFEMLQEKYGKGIKRRTSYDEIAQIDASAVVSANQ